MADGDLGVAEGVSIALGGMIGGGIFAVLGVVAQITDAATWAAFVLAGIVALCAAYSFNALNQLTDGQGGSVTFVQAVTGNATLAGMTGWTLLVGYVGSMAMYAYAFGSFAVGLAVVPDTVGTIPLRPVISVLAIAGFVGLNLLGARATGTAENVLVGGKVAILVVMGVGGLWYATATDRLVVGTATLTRVSAAPIMAAAVSFVAFQGWQLLYYDQERITDPVDTIRTAVYIAIPAAVALYVVVAITTLSLAPADVIQTHPERALAVAADPFLPYGYVIISLAALLSTGSAINATLFSTGYFAKGLLGEDFLPDQVGDAAASGLPHRTLLLLGVVTAGFTVYGSLGAITSFASLSFIVVFGGISALAATHRGHDDVAAVVPAVGAIGATLFLVLLVGHLYRAEPQTLVAVLGIAAVVVTSELLYFERDIIEAEVQRLEDAID